MVGLTVGTDDEKVVASAVEETKAALDRVLAIAACEWTLTDQLGPEGMNKISLKESLFLKLENHGLSPSLEEVPDEGRRRACEKQWGEEVAAHVAAKQTEATVEGARAACAPWVARIMKAKVEVIDPNQERLAEHMASMKDDHVSSAAAELDSSRLTDVLKAKALTAHRILMTAMDDVQSQFCGGMRQLSAPGLQDALSADEIADLCTIAVVAVRQALDTSYTVPALEAELTQRIRPRREEAAAADSARLQAVRSDASVPSAEGQPVGWLRALILGATGVGRLPGGCDDYEALDFLQAHVSSYLDPFLDGDVAPEECEERSEGLYYDRLSRAWEAAKGAAKPLPLAPPLAYAQYLYHCITKLNANHGFGAHIPGLGRTPIGQLEQEAYMKQGALAILKATERDFSPEQRVLGSYASVTDEDLLPIMRDHLTSLFLYHNELGDALANANREGEEQRRQERLRIWGYA